MSRKLVPGARISPLHAELDRAGRRLAKASVLAARRLQDRFPVLAVAEAIERRDPDAVVRLPGDVDAAFGPGGAIVRDAFARGGKLTAPAVNGVRR